MHRICTFWGFFFWAPTQTPPHLSIFPHNNLVWKSTEFHTKKTEESSLHIQLHNLLVLTQSSGWLRLHFTQWHTYIFPSLPALTAGFTLPTCTDVISSSRRFRPHHFRRRTLHRLRACSSDPRITCVWEAGGRASGVLGSPGGSGLAQRR